MRSPSLITIAVGAVVASGVVLSVRPPSRPTERPQPFGAPQAAAPAAPASPQSAAAPSASPPPAQAAARAAAKAAAAKAAAAPAPAWSVPDPDALPADDIFAQTVRRGRDLITKTSSLIGPDAQDPAMRFAGNGLACQSCHLQAGTQQYGLPLAGVWGVFPQYIGRENEVRTLEERVNGCMERSMNGHALPVDGPEMKAILAYIRFVSGPEQVGQSLKGRGAPSLPLMDRAADPAHGQKVFAETCASCHGADGQGQRLEAADAAEQGRRYQFPPLWGPDSYNDGAGMGRTMTAARFVHANMPFGTTFEQPQLSAEDAYDVMAYVNAQPRPYRENLDADYPDRSKKPVDAGYAPFVGPFSPEQHKVGPWKPIQDWLKANKEKLRAQNG